MARTLPAGMSTALVADGTAPRLLLALDFATPVYFYSGSGTVDYNNTTWTGNGFVRRLMTSAPDGVQKLTVEIPNADSSMSAIVLNQSSLRQVACQLYEKHDDDTVRVFDGYVSGYPELMGRVVITAINRSEQYEFTPRLTIAPHLCNHITPSGSEIAWGKRLIRLRSSDEIS